MEQLLTVQELSAILKISEGTVYYHSSKPNFPVVKIGRHNRYQLSKVLQYFQIAEESEVLNNVARDCSFKIEYKDMGHTNTKEG